MTNFTAKVSFDVSGRKAILIVSYMGFETKEIVVGDRKEFNVQLRESSGKLNEIVVVGYGSQRKSDVTTSVSSVKGRLIEDEATNSITQALTGKMSGVQISQTSGEPGSNVNIRIRGTSSITAGNTPLYVIDGVPISNQANKISSISRSRNSYIEQTTNPLASIDVADIESIEVLKDAASAAIYGSRGSNGVVLITTKKGKSGKAQIFINTRVGIGSILKKIDLLDAYQFAQIHTEAKNTAYLENVPNATVDDDNATRVRKAKAAGVDSPTRYQIPSELKPYLENRQGLTNTDWQDAIFRKALQQNYTLSARGGSENTKYFASLNYAKQEGIVIGSNLERFSARLNLEGESSNRFSYGLRLNPSRLQYRRVSSNGPVWNEGVTASALAQAPVFPVKNDDGSYHIGLMDWASATSFSPFVPSRNISSGFVANPVAIAEEVQDKEAVNRLIANAFLNFEIIDGLNYKLSFGVDNNDVRRDFYRPQSLVTLPWIRNDIDAMSSSGNTINWIAEHTIDYIKSFYNHNLSLLAGYSAQKEDIKTSISTGRGFANDLSPTINSAVNTTSKTYREQWSLLSYMFRAQYNFRNKYFFMGAIRRDGSSRFGKGNKWGNFPSFSVGWRISEEGFFRVKAVDEFKIRTSYGVTGNFQIPNYGYLAPLKQSKYVSANGDQINGLVQGGSGNDNLGWEQTKSFDVGFDISLFDNVVTFEADYYVKNTDGLLLDVNTPRSSGYKTKLQNIGKIQNAGYEFTLGIDRDLGDFHLTSSFNFSSNKNKVLALGPEDSPIYSDSRRGQSFVTRIGQPVGSYYGYVVEGIYNSQEEIDKHLFKSNEFRAHPGDFKFADLNGDGKITTDDRKIIGSYYPDFYYGLTGSLNYKNFNLSFALQGVYGNEIFNLLRNYTEIPIGGLNNAVDVVNRWKSPLDPGNGKVPRANFLMTGGNNKVSSYYVEDGSYLRVQNISLGYKVPEKIADNIGLGSVRIYVSAQNPFMFTKYSGYNPEVSADTSNQLGQGQDFGTYPLAKTYSLGLNISL